MNRNDGGAKRPREKKPYANTVNKTASRPMSEPGNAGRVRRPSPNPEREKARTHSSHAGQDQRKKPHSPQRQDDGPNELKKFFTPQRSIYFAIGAVLLILIACMVVNVLIGVRSIEVVGTDMSAAEDIVEIANVKVGSGYFSYNTKESEEKVMRLIPCIEDIRITRSIFGKVKITVSETKAYWYTEIFGEYYALSESLEVIKRTDTKKDYIDRGLVRIDFPKVESAILGKTIEFSDDGRDCSFIWEFLSEILESKLYKSGRLDQICIETKFEIFIVSDLKYKINVGKYSNVKYKLDKVESMLSNEIFEGDATWEINFVEAKDEIAPRPNTELNFDYLRA